jgi:hypothetical protein
MTDREVLCAMLIRANILFQVDNGCGWKQRIVVAGDRCFVFDSDGALCGIRSALDDESFDGGPR